MNNYVNKQDNLDEMDKFLETYNIPKINQEESDILNRQIIPSDIEAVIKNSQQINKSTAPNGFTGILPNISRRINTSPSQTIS